MADFDLPAGEMGCTSFFKPQWFLVEPSYLKYLVFSLQVSYSYSFE